MVGSVRYLCWKRFTVLMMRSGVIITWGFQFLYLVCVQTNSFCTTFPWPWSKLLELIIFLLPHPGSPVDSWHIFQGFRQTAGSLYWAFSGKLSLAPICSTKFELIAPFPLAWDFTVNENLVIQGRRILKRISAYLTGYAWALGYVASPGPVSVILSTP